MAERIHHGRAASPGLAIGPLVRAHGRPATATGRLRQPRRKRPQRLGAALARARGELERLAAADAGMGAEILEFQVALLDDPALAEPAFAAIAAGESAVAAWRACLDAQIAEYEAAEDDYFQARASDLRDLSDRVLAALGRRLRSLSICRPGRSFSTGT